MAGSEWLVDDIYEIDEQHKHVGILKTELSSKEDLKKLKAFLDREINHQDGDLYDSCLEELLEIRDDLKWSSSKDGKFILLLENWVLEARAKTLQKGWDKIFIGRSMIDPKQLNIGGWVQNENELNEMKKQIGLWAPPVSPKYMVEVE